MKLFVSKEDERPYLQLELDINYLQAVAFKELVQMSKNIPPTEK